MSASGVPIRLNGVSKSYGASMALAPLDLEVEAGTCLALIGPSGCGKSTLLRLVLGLLVPDRGTIDLGDLRVGPATLRQVRERVGYVIQEGGLFPHLSAAENVTLKARDLGWSADRMRARLAELAELVQLPAVMLARHPAELSGGQRQRVGLMRALALEPAALLMDEPLGALDPMIRARLQADLRAIFRRLKKTVVFVTHDMAEAAYLGDEIVLMREGRVIQRGAFRDLRDRPADPFVAEFLRAQRPPEVVAGEGAP